MGLNTVEIENFFMTRSTAELTCPFYAVVTPFVRLAEAWKFQDYETAAKIAAATSTMVKEYKVEVRIFEQKDQEIGLLVSSYEQGDVAQGVQVSFIQSQTAPSSKIRRKLGKTWLQVLEQHAAEIVRLKSSMLPLSPEENAMLTLREGMQESFLSQLKAEMREKVFEAVKWTYVQHAGLKNKSEQAKEEKKPAILNVTDSSIRKYLLEAYEIVAGIALRSNWKLVDSARATFDLFIAEKVARERRLQMELLAEEPKKPRKPRPKKKENPAPATGSLQLGLFDEAI